MNSKIVLVASFLLVTFITTNQAAYIDNSLLAKYICRDKSNGFRALVPGSCSQYYECINQKSILKTCTKYYDSIHQKCVNTNPGCVETIREPFNCKGPCCGIPDGGYAVDPQNQQIYYICKNNCIAQKNACKNGCMFDLIKLECSSPSNCADCTTPKPPCTPTTTPCVTTPKPCTEPTSTPCEPITTPCPETTTPPCEPTTPPCEPTTPPCEPTTPPCEPTTPPCEPTTPPCESTTPPCEPTTTPCTTTPCKTTTCSTTTCKTTTSTTPCKTTTCTTTSCTTIKPCKPPTPPCVTTKVPCTSSSKKPNEGASGDKALSDRRPIINNPSRYVLPLKMTQAEIDEYVRYGCVNKPNGFLLPSMTRCDEYYICRSNLALPVKCGFKYFNAKKGICDLPQNTGCIQAY